MKITIAYITSRPSPQFSWFVDSLAAQTTPEQRAGIQLIFVDGQLWDFDEARKFPLEHVDIRSTALHRVPRIIEVEQAVSGRFSYLHVPPKPCAWNGPFRQTQRDYFAAGNARNTAFILAESPYVCVVDDLSVLGPQWLNQMLHAAANDYVVCGAYKKLKKMVVVDGQLVSFEEYPAGVDSRWSRGSDGGIVDWHGSGMFGCSFGAPLEALLEVDGNDSAAVSAGGEDYDLGIRLERAGWPIKYNRNAVSFESEEMHHDGSKLPQIRKLVKPETLPAAYAHYQHVNPAEKFYSDHVMLNRLANETDRITPLIGDNLRQLRRDYQETGVLPIIRTPLHDWRDGQPLSEL